MKKYIFFVLTIIAYPIAVFAQDSLNLTVPKNFDFSTPYVALSTSNMIVSTLIALIVGYLSPYIPFIQRIDKTALRVASIIIPALIVVSIFGFKGDAMTVFMTTVWGLFSANSTHMYALQPIGEALELPYFMPKGEAVTDEEAEVTNAMIKSEKSRMNL
jgi:hypothetical protein